MQKKKSQLGSKDPFLFNNDSSTPDFPQLSEFLINLDVENFYDDLKKHYEKEEKEDNSYELEDNDLPISMNAEYSIIDDERILSNKKNIKIQFNFENFLDPISLMACIQSLNARGISGFYNDVCLLFKSEGNQIILSVIPDVQSMNYFNLPNMWVNFFKIIK